MRKVDADNPSRGLAGAVIKITGVDNSFVGTYVTGEGGYLTDVPWDTMPIGSYEAEEVTPPEGFTKSPDVNKCKQTFVWDGKRFIPKALVEKAPTVFLQCQKLYSLQIAVQAADSCTEKFPFHILHPKAQGGYLAGQIPESLQG
ncbi:prealbumin-like fold domain-containing protein [Oscillospiraceae bacterium 38-13]